MGSSITYHLAKSGLKTLNLERFELNHANGSSHGRTRIIRTAYSENPFYVPLVRRALELWKELERESKKKLLELTGGLMIGEPEGELVKGILKSAKRYGLPHEVLRGREISDKFKALKVSDEQVSVYENLAGVLFAEDCIRAHVSLAER
jgi:sarcosine oxidase